MPKNTYDFFNTDYFSELTSHEDSSQSVDNSESSLHEVYHEALEYPDTSGFFPHLDEAVFDIHVGDIPSEIISPDDEDEVDDVIDEIPSKKPIK